MKTMMKMMFAASVAVSVLSAATAANAAIVVFTDQAAFTAAITGAADNTFSFTGTYTDLGASYTRGAVTFNVGSSGFLSAYGDGGYGTNVSYLAGQETNLGISSTTSAVGFFLGNYSIVEPINYNFGGTSGTFSPGARPSTNFLGFVNTTGLLTGSLSTGIELDVTRFITGNAAPAVSAVPEAATWAMMIAGFGMMGAALRTRRQSAVVSFA